MSELKDRVQAAAAAAVAAGDRLRALPVPLAAGGIELKSAHDFVTQADRDTEAFLVSELSKQYPQDGFLGEETGETHVGQSDAGRWIIDPIDGTTNFIHGIPLYSISIAYEHAGQLVAGVVYAPGTDDLYVAARGMGAFHNGNPIHVSACGDPAQAVLGTSFAHRSPQFHAKNLRLLAGMLSQLNDFRRLGSAALDLCYVASGRTEGFFEVDLHIYDFAAGLVILEEAGGQVTGWPGEAHCTQTGNVLASNGLMHDWMTDCIRKYFA